MVRIPTFTAILLLFIPALTLAGARAGAPAGLLPDTEVAVVLAGLTDLDPAIAQSALQRVVDSHDTRFVPVLIELLRGYVPVSDNRRQLHVLEQLSGQRIGPSWADWVEWYGTTTLQPPPGFLEWKAQIFGHIDPVFAELLTADGAVRLRPEEIVWGGVSFDGIAALDNAPVILGAEAHYLTDAEPVFGIVVNGEARAYPLRIMDQHELANDVVGGERVSIAYCTLCGAGIAFRGTLPDGRVLTFGSSGLLYRSNKLMFDRLTRTLWNQLTGEPVLGPLADSGVRLEVAPLVVTSWQDWRREHPHTLVLDVQTGFERRYELGRHYGGYFSQPGTIFPVAQRSVLLPAKAQVFALYVNGRPKAYPLDDLTAQPIINDVVGDETVLVLSGATVVVDRITKDAGAYSYSAGAPVRAYRREAHEFRAGQMPDELRDEYGGVWRVTEEALIGPNGEQLKRLGGHLAFWFGWYAFFPQTDVYGVE